MKLRRHALAAFLLGFLIPALSADVSPAAKSEIDQLLSALGDSPCELFRDGDWREGEEAQNRLRQQYDALAGQGQIASAEDFIDRVATSNTDQVRCPGETPQPAATWFKHQLTQIRKQPVTDPNVYLEKK